MTGKELRKLYIDYFKSKDHKEIYSSSLIPDNDPSVLFTTAGMHPLVPYLLGEKHPQGKRLVDFQKCIRTGDIDEVGDSCHLTFFEMLGNWSLNDYFKEESLTMSHEFLTKVLNIPKEKLSVSVFGGDDLVSKDELTYSIWKSLGYPDERIFFYSKKENWWGPVGDSGPCGPDSEIFYDTGKDACSSNCGPSCSCGKYIEIWNNVFMEYNKKIDGTYEKMNIHNVDTGLGIERVLAIINNKETVYDTELFKPIIEEISNVTNLVYENASEEEVFAFRVIADHIRSATFILGDDKAVAPSNVDQGYILRRIIRRIMRYLRKLGINNTGNLNRLSKIVIDNYCEIYPELKRNEEFIYNQLSKEEMSFNRTLDKGMKVAEKEMNNLPEGSIVDSDTVFRLYDTFGFPIEFTSELAKEKGLEIDEKGFELKFKEHQEKSRIGAEKKFKGGLADSSVDTAKLHTATHLLNGALRKVLGPSIYQKGSNITPERLRFDFSFDRKLTNEEIEKVTKIVNEAIEKNIPVICEEMDIEEARKTEAIGVFEGKYGERVKVYTVEGYSKEICGGPHANNTRELNHFKIIKEESSSAGVRRIKAVLE